MNSEIAFNDTEVRAATLKLLAYCQAEEWAGYDPYDALNSRVLHAFPFLNTRLPRLILTQALKRSPINLRRLLLIPKTQNSKAIALFLSAATRLARIGVVNDGTLISSLVERLRALRSPAVPYWCWGYSFAWQTRTVVVPAGTPNLVATTFAANALLDAYECGHDLTCLNMAVNAAEYIVNELYWRAGSRCGFSYPLSSVRGEVHNANFLAAALLCRVFHHNGDRRFLEPALRVTRHSVRKQRLDGSWSYGEAPSQLWIDNFHTGYNLCALKSIGWYANTEEFTSSLWRGLSFFVTHFFRADGAPRYFHNRTYPIDVHSIAQSIITLVLLRELDPTAIPLARSVLRWAMNHMWDDRGFFYYRILPFYKIRTSYMRWSQAWMLSAMATLLSEFNAQHDVPIRCEATVLTPAC